MRRPLHSIDLKFVRAIAKAVLGRQADAWLAQPNGRLGGLAPLVLASEHHGAERVIAELDRIGSKDGRP
jgi:hypothetical protein